MEKKRLEFMDDEKHDKYMKMLFEEQERTEIKGILPARDRIKQYKTKSIRRNINVNGSSRTLVNQLSKAAGAQSMATLQTVPEEGGKVKFADRPTTAGIASLNG